MTANVGSIDRILRLIIGVVLVLAPFVSSMSLFAAGWVTWVSVIVGVVLVATAGMRFCPLYRIFGIRTCKV